MFHTYKTDSASVPNAAAGMLRWFVGLDGSPQAKDEAGNIYTFQGPKGDTGDTGPEGPVAVVDPLSLSGLSVAPAPVADKVQVFGANNAGRYMLAMVGPSGQDTRLQPHIGVNRVSIWQPNGVNNTAATTLGGLWTAPTLTGVALADTEIGRIRKAGAATAATAGNVVRLTSDAAFSMNTGFHMIGHFCPFAAGAVASRRFFAGLSASDPTNVALTGFAGVGVHADVNQTTLQIRGVNGVQTDLGAEFPAASATAWYRLEMFCPPLGEFIGLKVTNLMTGFSEIGMFDGPNLPAAGVFLAAKCAIITSAATAQTMWLGQWMVETDL